MPPSFQPKFFDKATLLQMSSDLNTQHNQLSDTAKALHSEKVSIRRKLDEVNEALAEVELELQNRPHSQLLPHTRGDTSSSPSPPTDVPLILSHESDYTATLNCSSLAMSDTSHVAVVDDAGSQSEQHHFATTSGEQSGSGHYQHFRGRRQSDVLLQHPPPSRYAQMRLNAFLEGVQLPNNNEHPLSPEGSLPHSHCRKFSTTTSDDNDDNGIKPSRSQPPSSMDVRRGTASSNYTPLAPNQDQQVREEEQQHPRSIMPAFFIDPAASSEFSPPPQPSEGGCTQEGRSGQLTYATTAGSSGSAVGTTSNPTNHLGEEIRPDSPDFKGHNSCASPPTTKHHQHQHPVPTAPITANECADSSAAYRYSFQLPHAWKHLGEALPPHQVTPPNVSLYHHRIDNSSPQPSNGSRQPSNGSGSPDGDGSRTQSGLDAVLPAAVIKGGGAGRRGHTSAPSTPLPQNERPGHGCNVHDALQRRYGPEMFSYHPYLVEETEIDFVKNRADNYRNKFPNATSTVFYVQMFPTELIGVGGRVLESVIRQVAGDDAGVVISGTAVTFNAVRATILSAAPFSLCHALRCRVMADRHGFWYARTYEAFLELREYCSNLRYISQQERHYITDGLASIPLIAEFATEVNIPSLGLPIVGHEPYDFILGRDPNHKTTFPFERPKSNKNNNSSGSPLQYRNLNGGDQLASGSGSPSNVPAATGAQKDIISPSIASTASIATTPLNSTASSVGAIQSTLQHPQQRYSSSNTTTPSSSPAPQQLPHQPFNPNSRPRPPNEILQHYIKLQAKLANILKGRNRGRGGGAQQHR